MMLGVSSIGLAVAPVETASTMWKQQVDLRVQPARTYPGDVLFVRSKNARAVTLFQKTYNLIPSSGEYVRFIPVPIDTKPAVYPLQTADGKARTQVTVQPKTFAVDAITVSQQMNSMRQNTARINADQQKIYRARSTSAPVPYFEGAFVMPVQGRLTTPYGYQRVVNGKPESRHLAIDIANKEGTPVVASNNGKVVLAEPLYLTGNTIMIDHGLNLFSSYAHLSKLEVKPGQLVKKGQVIGRVGTTGFSTGPHLHYAMLIGNTFINPNPFFSASPYQWK
ncbi:M23 family metallopeptidase [Brevibacillus sp. SYP-B805]|nr:M23 family metallopeptidase [Brevibacillus sp. SYP-B805]